MKFTSLRAAAVLAALGAAAFAGGVQPAPVPRSQQRQEVRKRVLFAPNLERWTPAGRGPGWTHAQVKRMAKKRRNVLRNRRAHRGRG
jgi:ABC-type sugar transport system substrate-binding protein